MDKIEARVDQETWLQVFAPGAVVVAASYLAIPSVRIFLANCLRGISGQAQSVVVLFVGAGLSAFAGIVLYLLSRLLHEHRFVWNWLATLSGQHKAKGPRLASAMLSWFAARSPQITARRRLYGEILPYVALDTCSPDSEWLRRLRGEFESLIGPVGSKTGSRRGYGYVASDMARSWLASQVGLTVSREAWQAATRFCQLSDAYTTWGLALPAVALICSVPLRGLCHLAWVYLGLAVVVGLFLHWACSVEVFRNWYLWQNELSRLFYVSRRPSGDGQQRSAPNANRVQT